VAPPRLAPWLRNTIHTRKISFSGLVIQITIAISVWRPLYKKDQLLLGRVQHAITRWSPNLSHLPYEERLKILKIPQLEERFDRADLIQMFRLTHNLFPEDVENFCLFSEGRRLRGHEFKIANESFKTTSIRQHFLTNHA
jgi:hypothetical protein